MPSLVRPSGRAFDELRPITLETGVTRYAEGSCLAKFGNTHVLCTASWEKGVPGWMKGKGERLGDRRVRHAAARHAHAWPPRGRCRASSLAARRKSSA